MTVKNGFTLRDRLGACAHWWALVPDAQSTLLNLEIGVVVTTQAIEPGLPASTIGDAVVEAELISVAAPAVGRRHPSNQAHRELRTKACTEAQCVLHRVTAARRQVQLAEFGIDFLEVWNRRDDAGFERLDGDDIFYARAHCMARETLGVGNNDLVRVVAKHRSKRVDFCRRAAATGGCIGLVRHEHRLRGHLLTGKPMHSFHPRNQVFHDAGDVIDIQPRAVEGAVCRNGTEHLGNRLQAAFTSRTCGLDNERSGTHAGDHAVTAPVERCRRILRVLVSCCCARCQEACANPLHHMIGGHIVCGDDDHAFAAATADPVFRQRHGLRRAGASTIDLGVRSARTDLFGELRVAHRQNPEQEAPVEVVFGLADERLEFGYASVDLVDSAATAVALMGQPFTQAFETLQLLTMSAFDIVVIELLAKGVVTGECRSENDSRVVT